MLNQTLAPHSDIRALSFLRQNPTISESLLAEVEQDLGRAATIISPVLDAPNRCEISSFYIQAVTTGRTAFLTTNLPEGRSTHVTEVGTNWLVGRDGRCAIAVRNSSISRCHAVVGHCCDRGFYIMDVGSSNGTFVNRRRIVSQTPRFLQDGDLIELSNVRLEFFVSGVLDTPPGLKETLI